MNTLYLTRKAKIMINCRVFKISIILIPTLLSLSAMGQHNKPESPKGYKNPSENVSYLNQVAQSFINKNADTAIKYASQAAEIAKSQNLYSELGIANLTIAKGYYFKSQYNQALKHAAYLQSAAQQSKSSELQIQYHNLTGNIYIDLGKIGDAVEEYKKVVALSIATKNISNLSIGYNNLAYCFRYIGDYNNAIQYLYKKIRIDEAKNSPENLGSSYQQLATIYLRKKDYKNAKDCLEKSLAYYQTTMDIRNIAINTQLLSVYYFETGNQVKAIEFLKHAVTMAEQAKDKRSIAIFTSELARYQMQQNQFKEAETSYIKAIKLHEEINLQNTIPGILVGYGVTLLRLGNVDAAKKELDKGLKAAQIRNAGDAKKMAHEYLLEYYISSKDVSKALEHKNAYLAIRDSMFNEENNRIINELKTQYETEKKEASIKLLNSENALQKQTIEGNRLALLSGKLELDKKNLLLGNQNLLIDYQQLELKNHQSTLAKNNLELKNKEQKINILNLNDKNKSLEIQKKNRQLIYGVIAFLLLALAAYLLYNRYRLRQKNKLQTAIIKEQDEAAKAIISAEENERSRMSQTLHDGLGQLLSAAKMNLQAVQENLHLNPQMTTAYNNALILVDDSIKEMRTVSHQMVTNNVVRTGLANALKELIEKIDTNRLKVNLNVNGLLQNIEPDIQVVVYRIIQESINNVIKHSRADTLNIDLDIDSMNLSCRITDNGIGFDTSRSVKRVGIGLDNIATRIKFLKGVYNIKSTLGRGTELSFQIPLAV